MKNFLLYSFLFLLFFSGSKNSNVMGYKPVYMSQEDAAKVVFEGPRDMKTQGKIYIKNQYVFIGDIGLGVHVIDNTNPENPQKIGFLKIYGNHDIAIKGQSLYADNLEDLVTIDISNMENPVETNRVKGLYTIEVKNYPPNVPYNTYFECVDPSKGIVVDWVEAELSNPECYTTY